MGDLTQNRNNDRKKVKIIDLSEFTKQGLTNDRERISLNNRYQSNLNLNTEIF